MLYISFYRLYNRFFVSQNVTRSECLYVSACQVVLKFLSRQLVIPGDIFKKTRLPWNIWHGASSPLCNNNKIFMRFKKYNSYYLWVTLSMLQKIWLPMGNWSSLPDVCFYYNYYINFYNISFIHLGLSADINWIAKASFLILAIKSYNQYLSVYHRHARVDSKISSV